MNWSVCALGWIALSSGLGVAFSACSSSSPSALAAADAGGSATFDGGPGVSALANISPTYASQFQAGGLVFEQQMQAADGLGPLYTKQACSDCHTDAARGPGAATKMAAVEADGLTPLADQSLLPFGNTQHPLVVTEIPGARTPILSPFDGGKDLGDAGMVTIRVTNLVGPPLFGRGYMDAVADSEIERMASQQATRSDGVHGRVNRLVFVSQPNPDSTFDSHRTGDMVIGRFGLKARIATLDEFSADALQGDMGLTSPMRQTEFANPDGITDDLKTGVDVSADEMNARAMYVRLLAIPVRSQAAVNGQAWFESCNCQVCHSETLHTRADYPIPQLADIDAPVFTDMLLHDMGDTLSDSIANGNEGLAGPRDWRTAPLIGVRFSKSFLHDGRATTVAEAIALHDGAGSEAATATQCYNTLAPEFRQQIIDFVSSL